LGWRAAFQMMPRFSICRIFSSIPIVNGSGIGRRLMENCLERFDHVRTKVLLTDDEERQHAFYKSLGYKNTRELKKIPLNAFVQMNGIDLA
jgi:predicted GNAT family N-acyltransferase